MTRIVVFGDVVLDRDLDGTADRLCPDAPVPVVDETSAVERPGGAGLTAMLAARSGAEVTLVAGIAADPGGARLRALLDRSGVQLIALTDHGTTAEKQRVRVGGRSLLRIDRGGNGRLGALPGQARTAALSADAIVVADYGRQITGHREVRKVIANCVAAGVPVVWDPHPRGQPPVAGVTLVTPNRAEAEQFARHAPAAPGALTATLHDGLTGVATRAFALRASWEVEAIAVTLGADGALLVNGDGPPLMIGVDAKFAAGDTCGAGDALAAAAGAALGEGAGVVSATEIGVEAATRFVAAGAAGNLSGAEAGLRTTYDRPDLQQRIDAVRRSGGTVVATGGCFDVLHPGHISTLQRARQLGDMLVVLMNSDTSVRRLKGESRPAQREADRAAVLRALECVDEVVVFDDDTPVRALRRLRPDVFVKGGDYSATQIPETEAMASWGGIVVTVPFVDGRSTTRILDRLLSSAATTREHSDVV
jgi:D-beta-D-heptose 7-phosphate kinase/D-beta-D-heptose 1-phosphate adenosyltransferase